MPLTSAQKWIVAAQVVVVCALTWSALELVRYYVGRGGLWVFGLLLLLFAGLTLFRLRKKI